MRLEVADPSPVGGGVVDVDDHGGQSVVVTAAVGRPSAEGGVRAEGGRAERVDHLGRGLGDALRARVGDQPSVVELGRQQDLETSFRHTALSARTGAPLQSRRR
ncbi:hypothetical protein [Actinoplanes subtropicus]|uniref:hypothetical protein n=1 Tax=Actinoplanes subtropicus TaxID=543632 RepID=UPI0012FC2867|nr:hypothetical protein [Actinoplanes subtropicus]